MVIAQATRIRMILRKTPLKVYSNLNKHRLSQITFIKTNKLFHMMNIITTIFPAGAAQRGKGSFMGNCPIMIYRTMQEGTCSAKLQKRVGTKEEFCQNAAALSFIWQRPCYHSRPI